MTLFIDDFYCFLEKHLEEFLEFCEGRSLCQNSLCYSIAEFIEHKGLPFNMQDYMKEQSKSIQEYISEKGDECSCPESRQKAISHWIQSQAKDFRTQVVSDQAQMIRELNSRLVRYLPDPIKEKISLG